MARPKNHQRKPEMLAQFIEYLHDKPLSALTFRTVADALGVGAYTLVYHFGTREQLITGSPPPSAAERMSSGAKTRSRP